WAPTRISATSRSARPPTRWSSSPTRSAGRPGAAASAGSASWPRPTTPRRSTTSSSTSSSTRWPGSSRGRGSDPHPCPLPLLGEGDHTQGSADNSPSPARGGGRGERFAGTSMKDYTIYSFWLETCGDDLTPRPGLDGSIDVDVAVLGAG